MPQSYRSALTELRAYLDIDLRTIDRQMKAGTLGLEAGRQQGLDIVGQEARDEVALQVRHDRI